MVRRNLGTLQRVAIGAGIGAAMFTVSSALSYRPGLTIEFLRDHPVSPAILHGFYPPEVGPDELTFAWAGPRAALTLDELDRTQPWVVTFRVRAGRPAPRSFPLLSAAVDEVTVRQVTLSNALEDIQVFVPARARRQRGLRVDLFASTWFVPGDHDPRRLAFMLDRVTAAPAGDSVPHPSRETLLNAAATGAVVAAASVLFVVTRWVLPLLVLPVAAAYGALMNSGQAPHVGYSGRGVSVALFVTAVVLVVAAGAAVLRHGRYQLSAGTRWALALTMAAGFVKLLVLLHPDMLVGDSVFHVNRLRRVLGGTYYFTSAAPGGAFPYPVALYLIAAPMRHLTGDWILLLRTMVAMTDLAAGLALHAVVSVVWGTPALGAITVLLYHLVPAGFQVQAVAYLTNGFGQAMSVMALAWLAAGPRLMPRGWALLIATALCLLAFVSHTGSFVILVGVMATSVALLGSRGDGAARRVLRDVLTVGIASGSLAVVLYYGHFVPTYIETFQQMSQPGRALDLDELGPQRSEAHQTPWSPTRAAIERRATAVPGYARKYWGWPLILAAAIGGVSLWRERRRDALLLLLVAWLGTCLGFLLLGVFTPIDLRYYLAAFPPLAALAAAAIYRSWGRASWRIALVALLIAIAVQGVRYWFAWFGWPVPR